MQWTNANRSCKCYQNYIDWCIKHVNLFFVSQKLKKLIKQKIPYVVVVLSY